MTGGGASARELIGGGAGPGRCKFALTRAAISWPRRAAIAWRSLADADEDSGSEPRETDSMAS